MRQVLSALCVFAIGVLLPSVATADSIFLDIRGITGETPTPGHPDALAAQSVTVVPDGFSAVRRVDSASPQIANAVVTANVFPGATILFYNGTPAGLPVATLPFQNVIATSFQLLSGGINPLEQDSFTSGTHYSKFLELPGITGDASTPGHPGIMAIQSFALEDQHFSVVRQPDSATPDIALAVTIGRSLPNASIFFYDPGPTGTLVTTLIFEDVVATSFHIDGTISPLETDGFAFANLTAPTVQGVSEPASALLLIAGVCLLSLLVRNTPA